MAWKTGHGLDEYMEHLEAIDGKEVHIMAGASSGTTVGGVRQAETFDALVDRVARRMADKQDRGL